MSLIKSYSVGNGDMYYIRHNSDNFSIIDCCIPDDRAANILPELATQSRDKHNLRFISTHPDQDHISGLVELDDLLKLRNFYCVKNAATKPHPTADFDRYVELRDSSKAFYLRRGVNRHWMNQSTEVRQTSGIEVLWPIVDDPDHKTVLRDAAVGRPPNNISPIIKYRRAHGVSMIWMGDLETDFMQKLTAKFKLPLIDVLFAPHHGRASGKVPTAWLAQMNPQLVVIGNAPSEYLDYYRGYNIITQNRAGDVLFDAQSSKTHIYVGDPAYEVDFLDDEGLDHTHGLYYVGSLNSR
ncbi:ComEC/Rec2 family competence protein [Nocardioides dongkuii]|uniref:hypothetical protein n=1 Tax=Nocardioides dongkuii TaxID=2760089 RepID=UPI0018782A1B|nr:hypothetical protein [Nocardioides dongkuii]